MGGAFVAADSGVSTSITYLSPSQVNLYYTIDPDADPVTATVWLWTLFGISSQPFTIDPTAATVLSNGSLYEATTDGTDLGDNSYDVTMSSRIRCLDEYGFLQSGGTVLDFPPCTLGEPRLCVVWNGVSVLVEWGPLIGAAVHGLWTIWQQRVGSPYGWPGDDGTVAPGPDWTWQGPDPPGGAEGNWGKQNPDGTKERLHPDLNHPAPKAPHWD